MGRIELHGFKVDLSRIAIDRIISEAETAVHEEHQAAILQKQVKSIN